MVEDGVLEKIDSSPWVSNMVIAPKPIDEIRIWDLRNPNKAIIPDRAPLATMDELSDFFAGATIFSKITWNGFIFKFNLQKSVAISLQW